jgi:hypothetical protein
MVKYDLGGPFCWASVPAAVRKSREAFDRDGTQPGCPWHLPTPRYWPVAAGPIACPSLLQDLSIGENAFSNRPGPTQITTTTQD